MLHRLRWLIAPALAAVVIVPFAAATRAETWASETQTDQTATIRGTVTCEKLQPAITRGGFTDPVFILSDADLVPGNAGLRFCLFWDQLAEAYSAWPINQRSAEEFRTTKAEVLPLLADAGIDLCQIGFFSPLTFALAKATTPADWHDVGRDCETQLYAHGPLAEQRLDEVRQALAASRAKAVELFGWSSTWPLRIFIYDEERSYGEGIRADGRYPRGESLSRRTAGVAIFNSDFMTVVTIDIAKLKRPELLTWAIAHEYFHVVQAGILGDAHFLPEFASEGGADYFASLVLGPESREAALVFQIAVEEAHAGKSSPLSRHVRAGTGHADAYLRGFVAFRYLAERWGSDAWIQLMWDNVHGSPNNYLLNMSRLTSMTVDEFDRDMNEWLRGFTSLIPTPTPRPTRTPLTPR